MDIENTEWLTLPYMMNHNQLKDIQQMAIEIHSFDFIGMKTVDQVKCMNILKLSKVEHTASFRFSYI